MLRKRTASSRACTAMNLMAKSYATAIPVTQNMCTPFWNLSLVYVEVLLLKFYIAKVRVTFTDDDARLTINLPTSGRTWMVVSKSHWFLWRLYRGKRYNGRFHLQIKKRRWKYHKFSISRCKFKANTWNWSCKTAYFKSVV